MGEYNNNGKLLHAIRSRTIRELVDKANELHVLREDIISVLPDNGFYTLLYYYQGL